MRKHQAGAARANAEPPQADPYYGVRTGSRTERLICEALGMGELGYSRDSEQWYCGPYSGRVAREVLATAQPKAKTTIERRAELERDRAGLMRTCKEFGTDPSTLSLFSKNTPREVEITAREFAAQHEAARRAERARLRQKQEP